MLPLISVWFVGVCSGSAWSEVWHWPFTRDLLVLVPELKPPDGQHLHRLLRWTCSASKGEFLMNAQRRPWQPSSLHLWDELSLQISRPVAVPVPRQEACLEGLEETCLKGEMFRLLGGSTHYQSVVWWAYEAVPARQEVHICKEC